MADPLWYIKYQPKTLDEYVFQNDNIKDQLTKYVEDGDIPDLLFVGIQGTGKSTAAQCLINDLGVDGSDLLTINASNESGIDVIRNRITDFCMPFPWGKFKVVLLEEADGLSQHAQRALRALMDQHKDTVRFIFTANYEHLIIPPLQSRLGHVVRIDAFDTDSLLDRVALILEEESIDVPEIEYLLNHVERFQPDLRRVLNSVQQASTTGVLKDVAGGTVNDDLVEQWTEVWGSEPTYNKLAKLVRLVDDSNYEPLYRVMYENVERLDNPITAIPLIAEHLHKAGVVVDQEINLHACLIRVFGMVDD